MARAEEDAVEVTTKSEKLIGCKVRGVSSMTATDMINVVQVEHSTPRTQLDDTC